MFRSYATKIIIMLSLSFQTYANDMVMPSDLKENIGSINTLNNIMKSSINKNRNYHDAHLRTVVKSAYLVNQGMLFEFDFSTSENETAFFPMGVSLQVNRDNKAHGVSLSKMDSIFYDHNRISMNNSERRNSPTGQSDDFQHQGNVNAMGRTEPMQTHGRNSISTVEGSMYREQIQFQVKKLESLNYLLSDAIRQLKTEMEGRNRQEELDKMKDDINSIRDEVDRTQRAFLEVFESWKDNAKKRFYKYRDDTVANAFTVLCKHGNNLASLSENEYLSLIFARVEQKDDLILSRVYVLSREEVLACNEKNISSDQLKDKAISYLF